VVLPPNEAPNEPFSAPSQYGKCNCFDWWISSFKCNDTNMEDGLLAINKGERPTA